MNTNLTKPKIKKPPILLRGLFLNIVLIISLINTISWFIINFQTEQLISKRTLEFASSITKIAANSSAEAILAEDQLQLRNIIDNISSDPYVIHSTIFAEDGQIIIQSSDKGEQTSQLKNLSENENIPAFSDSSNEFPFIEKIRFQGVTIGWFQIIFDKKKLEDNFFLSFNHAKNIILLTSILFLSILFILIFRYHQRVQKLVNINHKQLQLNTPQILKNKKEWLDAVYQLYQMQYQQSVEQQQQPNLKKNWVNCASKKSVTFCMFEFSIYDNDNEQIAEFVTQADNYIQAAIQTHGVYHQGNILSGYLIPIINKADTQEVLSETISLIYIIKELISSIPYSINMKIIIASGDVITFENSINELTGFLLAENTAKKTKLLMSLAKYNSVYSMNIERADLEVFAEVNDGFESLLFDNYQLSQIKQSLQLQLNRQVSYLKENNCIL